jgi:hypothetical protein
MVAACCRPRALRFQKLGKGRVEGRLSGIDHERPLRHLRESFAAR